MRGVQRGVSSRGYRRGPPHPREDAVWFITMVARGYLEGKQRLRLPEPDRPRPARRLGRMWQEDYRPTRGQMHVAASTGRPLRPPPSKRTPTYARLRSSAPGLPRRPAGRTRGVVDHALRGRPGGPQRSALRQGLARRPYPEQLAQVPPIPEVMKPLSQNMLDTDPPDHERLRGAGLQGFQRRAS